MQEARILRECGERTVVPEPRTERAALHRISRAASLSCNGRAGSGDEIETGKRGHGHKAGCLAGGRERAQG
eukprot:scaffold4419_cov128-Isochrysis_galbana.AAC.5